MSAPMKQKEAIIKKLEAKIDKKIGLQHNQRKSNFKINQQQLKEISRLKKEIQDLQKEKTHMTKTCEILENMIVAKDSIIENLKREIAKKIPYKEHKKLLDENKMLIGMLINYEEEILTKHKGNFEELLFREGKLEKDFDEYKKRMTELCKENNKLISIRDQIASEKKEFDIYITNKKTINRNEEERLTKEKERLTKEKERLTKEKDKQHYKERQLIEREAGFSRRIDEFMKIEERITNREREFISKEEEFAKKSKEFIEIEQTVSKRKRELIDREKELAKIQKELIGRKEEFAKNENRFNLEKKALKLENETYKVNKDILCATQERYDCGIKAVKKYEKELRDLQERTLAVITDSEYQTDKKMILMSKDSVCLQYDELERQKEFSGVSKKEFEDSKECLSIIISNYEEIIRDLKTTLKAEIIKNEFECPISMTIMTNPVIAADGHTYQHSEIERWLITHNTSPLTGGILTNTTLIPNHTLRKLIDDIPHYLIE